MNVVSLIRKKVYKQELSGEEIEYFVKNATNGSIPDYQISAMLMAIRLNGMSHEEIVSLTIAMEKSGDVCDLSSLEGIPVDKHSTGGVGDTTTLIVAPLVAACGVSVAKMSGRGLGHTGGTLDKLESIPGMRIDLSEEAFINQVKEIGIAVIGQTKNLAPADKIFYSLRDVTGTVDSLPLICSSILSKKLASGARGIVLDVKTGDGALMPTLEDSIRLAQLMVQIGCNARRNVVALVTDMDEPLGSHIGNALEVKEAIEVLNGITKGPLLQVSLELGAQMLIAGKATESVEQAKKMLLEALESGRSLEKLKQMIMAQGGDASVCDDVSLLPQPKVIKSLLCPKDGYVVHMDTIGIGNAAQEMGAGRKTKADLIDPSVGIILRKRIGDKVSQGEVLAELYAKSEESADEAGRKLLETIQIGENPVPRKKLVHALVNKDEVIPY